METPCVFANLGSSFHHATKWTPQMLVALRGPTTWKYEVPEILRRFKVCCDMETMSSLDLGSGFETPQLHERAQGQPRVTT